MQKKVWENEHKNPRLVTGADVPQTSVKDFLRWLRREEGMVLENIFVLDLGCGNGKNTNYIATLDPDNRALGIDISQIALDKALAATDALVADKKMRAHQVKYVNGNIGVVVPAFPATSPMSSFPLLPNSAFDLALDVTSSNSLSEKERDVCLSETHRALKPDGYFFVRALAKDGDKNAQTLLKLHPGPEKDTYIMPGMGLLERVFSKADFIANYSPLFEILRLEKETHYSKFAGRSYKRNFWIAYLKKRL